MNYRKRLCCAALMAVLCTGPGAWAVTPWAAQEMAEAVAAGAWKQSETIYRELLASDTNPDDLMPLKYNLAVSLLQQKQFEEAKGLFETVVKDSKSESLRAQASYNLGNTLFALEKLDEAKKAFEESLLMNSDDDDARYNIEVILRKQKENEDKKKQDEQDKKDNEKDKDKNEDQDRDQSKKDEQSKDGEDKKDSKDDQGSPDDQKGQDKKDQGQNEKDGEKSDSQNGQQQPGQQGKSDQRKEDDQAAGMSPAEKKAAQEAQEKARLLEYFRQQERDGRPDMRVRQQAPPPGGKTW